MWHPGNRWEEFRKAELGRVSMILANTGIPDEWGNVYDKETWNKQNGTDRTGGSYWYQRLMHYSFYNSPDVPFKSGGIEITYKMDKHNLYWPIPHFAETANSEAKLWQNFGYDGEYHTPAVGVYCVSFYILPYLPRADFSAFIALCRH